MRIAIAFLTVSLLTALTLSTACAQEPPAPLSPPNTPLAATGSISGVIVFDGRPGVQYGDGIMVVPADLPQPVSMVDGGRYFIGHDRSGSFLITGLATGEYLVGLDTVEPDYVPSLTESIFVLDDREPPLGLPQTTHRYPATRVRVQSGQTTAVHIYLPLVPTVELITTLPGLPRGAGSISGRIYRQWCDRCRDQFFLFVIPADLGRALDLVMGRDPEAFQISTDIHGFYTVTDIADGEYLVAPPGGGREYTTSFSEKVPYPLGAEQIDLPARRVRITNGEAVFGVDFLLKEPRLFHSSSEIPDRP